MSLYNLRSYLGLEERYISEGLSPVYVLPDPPTEDEADDKDGALAGDIEAGNDETELAGDDETAGDQGSGTGSGDGSGDLPDDSGNGGDDSQD